MSLQYDPAKAVEALTANDPTLGSLIAAAGPLRIVVRGDRTTFDVLLRSIIYQQLSDRAASTIYGRVVDLVENGGTNRAAGLMAQTDDALRGAGMSFAKIRAARDLAEKELAGELLPHRALEGMSDDEIVDRLTEIRGVGPWTVHMLLIFHLGRPDVLPTTDLGVKKGFMYTYGMDALPSPETLAAQGELWRPYRSVASWYLWRAVDMNTGVAPPAL